MEIHENFHLIHQEEKNTTNVVSNNNNNSIKINPSENNTNILALIALIFSFLFAPFGLFLEIVAKNQENENPIAKMAIRISIGLIILNILTLEVCRWLIFFLLFCPIIVQRIYFPNHHLVLRFLYFL